MKAILPGLATWFVPVVLVGCAGAPAQDKVYDVKGKVVANDSEKNTVTLDHEDIPGLMKAMQMKFAVNNPKLLEGVKVGDQVQGKLRVKPGGDYVVTDLQKQ